MPDVHHLTEEDVRGLQREYNAWTDKYLAGRPHLIVDGERGALFNRRTEAIKYALGYGRGRDGDITREFLNRMRNPRSKRVRVHGKIIQNFPRGMMGIGMARRARQRAAYHAAHVAAAITPGVTTFDGVPVAKCAVPLLKWARAHGWQGRLVSGWRSIPYSISLCFRICGRASCPGTCAGAGTNHVGKGPGRFALDVSDYVRFGHVMARCPLSPKIHNALPHDLVHFSPTGR